MGKKTDTKDMKNLDSNLKRLVEISEWFDNQSEINVEEGLKKVKEAVELIKTSRERLREVENEFEEIKKKIDIKEDDGKDETSKEEENF